ncbi:hypothetical protein [Allosphingosinicella sp.]|uniref:hypothetical protein n=1 Tax=Allosphingosinicella sp. TaxID=2823234 RepID=UPI002F077715
MLLLILALVIVVAIVLVWTNVIEVNWNSEAESPVNFQVNPVTVGTETREFQTPTIQVGNAAQPPANAQ